MQIATNIADSHPDSSVIHFDFENATTKERILGLTGWSSEKLKQKYVHLNSGIYTENLYKMVRAIHRLKVENKEMNAKLRVDTGLVDDEGNKIFELPPTVILVDSLATMVPGDQLEDDDLGGSMSASAIAKANNRVMKLVTGFTKEANIIIILINHITKKIEIGMTKTQAELNYLKQD